MSTPLTISFGSDHGGLPLRRDLIAALKAKGHTVIDRGTDTPASCDYPDYAQAVGADVTSGKAKYGILI
jgi:ribose 5-phosphate isomerase B